MTLRLTHLSDSNRGVSGSAVISLSRSLTIRVFKKISKEATKALRMSASVGTLVVDFDTLEKSGMCNILDQHL